MTARRRGNSKSVPLKSRLTYHLRCLREDATDPGTTTVERLALVRERAARIREVRQKLDSAKEEDTDQIRLTHRAKGR
jgi:hypothetical protein